MIAHMRRLLLGASLLLKLAACGATATPSGTDGGTTSVPTRQPGTAGEPAAGPGDETPYVVPPASNADETPYVVPPAPTEEVTPYPAPAP